MEKTFIKELADNLLHCAGDDYLSFCRQTLQDPGFYTTFELGSISVPASGTNITLKFTDYSTVECNKYVLEFNTAWLFDKSKLHGLDGRPGMETNNKMTLARLRILSAIWQIIEEKDTWLEKHPSHGADHAEVAIFANEDGSLHWWRTK